VFFWTPPHFWALALLIKDDYARAGIPMLPVVKGVEATRWNILAYSLVVVTITLLFFFTTSAVGWIYLFAAVVLGTVFLSMASRLVLAGRLGGGVAGAHGARMLYLYSLLYLALIFGVLMVDSVVRL
jgi:protoheme IX farnesyltransferase